MPWERKLWFYVDSPIPFFPFFESNNPLLPLVVLVVGLLFYFIFFPGKSFVMLQI